MRRCPHIIDFDEIKWIFNVIPLALARAIIYNTNYEKR